MIGKYPVITLCGSTRFKDAFMEAQKRLTFTYNIVISVGLFGHSSDDEVWALAPSVPLSKRTSGICEGNAVYSKLVLLEWDKKT